MSKHPFDAEPIKTSDGSYTLKLKNAEEQYHSLNGALQESQHVFINAGLQYFNPRPNPIFILEVGMGTGLNALLSGRLAVNERSRMFYHAIEPYPLSSGIIEKLNYPSLFEEDWVIELNDIVHKANGDIYLNFKDYFFINCFHSKVQETPLPDEKYHLVYFDAFGFDTQSEMWTKEVFSKIFASMQARGILVTYSAKGEVRRALKSAGFTIEKIPGPPGKREMTRAIKP